MPERSQTGLLVSEMTINIDTGRVTGVGRLPREGAKAVYAIAERYLALAANMLSEAKSTLHVAYDPGLVGAHGSSGRYIMPTATNPSAKAAIWEITGRDAGPADSLIILGPEFSGYRGNDESLAEIVAVDLTAIVESLYPIECSGPIKTMMPYLTQIAGNLIIPGGDPTIVPSGGDPDNAPPTKVEKAIARAYRSFAVSQLGPSESNQYGRLATTFPAWQYLADMVGQEAGLFAPSVRTPMPLPAMVYSIRRVIASAMTNLGVDVVPAAPVSMG